MDSLRVVGDATLSGLVPGRQGNLRFSSLIRDYPMTRVVPDSTWLKNWWLWTNGKLFLRQPLVRVVLAISPQHHRRVLFDSRPMSLASLHWAHKGCRVPEAHAYLWTPKLLSCHLGQ